MFNLGNNKWMTFAIILIIILVALYFFSGEQVYQNEGELTANESDAMTEKMYDGKEEFEDVDMKGRVRYSPQTRVPTNTLGGYGELPNANPFLMGEDNQVSMSKDQDAKEIRQAACFPKAQLTPAELLPQDESSTWARVHPQGQGSLMDRNFLQSGHHIGINTVGQTLRNANQQLRSEPPNPQVKVSPWVNSTIQPDTNRRTMEIGSGTC